MNNPLSNGLGSVDSFGQFASMNTTDPQPVYVYSGNGPNNSPNELGISNTVRDGVFDSMHYRYFLADTGNNRILVYNLNSDLSFPDKIPDYVLGQATFKTRTNTSTVNGLSSPKGLAYDPDHDRLFVCDTAMNRVVVFDTATITNQEDAVHVLGQPNFTSSSASNTQNSLYQPQSLIYDTARRYLFVTDSGHQRILVFDTSSITDGENAINVIGQPNFTTTSSAITQSGLSNPDGIAYDPARKYLFVSQAIPNRVSVFSVSTLANGLNATYMLGQVNFTNSSASVTQNGLSSPRFLDYDPSTQLLFVAQTTANRVSVFDTTTLSTHQNATAVIGQANFTSSTTGSGANGLSGPTSVRIDPISHLAYVVDTNNSRIVVFDGTVVGMHISTTSLAATEQQSSSTATVVLTSQPPSPVVVTATSSNPAAASVSPTSLTFTSGNWNTPQQLTISGVADLDTANETATVTLSVVDASSDDAFDSLADQAISVTIADDDRPSTPAISFPTANGRTTGNVSGTGQDGNTVTVTGPGSSSCSAVVSGGNWDCVLSPLPADGTTGSLSAIQHDGNYSSVSSTPITITIDTTAPNAPVVSLPTASSVSADLTPMVTGNAEADSTIVIWESSTQLCTATADGAGDWSCVSSVLSDGSHTITATAADAVGNTSALSDNRVFRVASSSSIVADDDADGISNSVEDNAFNHGDGNGDGIADSSQNTVTSIPNPVSGGSTTLQASCPIAQMSVASLNTLHLHDAGYRYPYGLVDFRLSCSHPGGIATVIVFLDRKISATGFSWRKIDPVTGKIITIPVTTISNRLHVTAIRYSISDGGLGDADHTVNGIIADPAGYAQETSRLSSTGLLLKLFAVVALLFIASGGGYLGQRALRRRHR